MRFDAQDRIRRAEGRTQAMADLDALIDKATQFLQVRNTLALALRNMGPDPVDKGIATEIALSLAQAERGLASCIAEMENFQPLEDEKQYRALLESLLLQIQSDEPETLH
jgi:hypothetical protein